MKLCVNHSPEDSIAYHYPEAVQWRRALHRYPQPSWLEFYATGFVAEKLSEWGYDLLLGKDIISPEKQLLPPSQEKLETEYKRAIKAGIKEKFLFPAKGGFTGVVGVLKGSLPGPTVGFRFDIDANEVMEARDNTHRPVREGFVSQIPGYAHMCGHDAHTAMGLLLALYFAENRDKIKGTVKFLFQPNEENLSGAAAMVDKGLVDDLDYILGGHVGINLKQTGQIAVNVHSFMALSRFEVTYYGKPAHAALRPDEGKNALLGACTAVNNLYAIARHGLGASRVNVGILHSGSTWNVIPDKAYLRLETRGATNEINEYMVQRAYQILEGAAKMHDLTLEIKPAASAISTENSPKMVELSVQVAQNLPSIKEIVPECAFNASEDFTVMMERVQKKGGEALYVVFGTPTYGGHHTSTFDIDETVIKNGAEFFAVMYNALVGN
ncbi:putative amino acid amidohydrolase [Carboxydothermus islandicus]|uniref:Putative amino acid amidohydrolase n=1 Tax=Carboxydothermus islandicus TaxID=661089 RepID=A0A1L8D472_9THEO|nr:amidohydrolase [Carboxydothermus islandicus]GAV25973.1 putative amino acid amidohydrolase [Carboxydothermus islandicus]